MEPDEVNPGHPVLNEYQWLDSVNPLAMLDFLDGDGFDPRREKAVNRISGRELRLFALAMADWNGASGTWDDWAMSSPTVDDGGERDTAGALLFLGRKRGQVNPSTPSPMARALYAHFLRDVVQRPHAPRFDFDRSDAGPCRKCHGRDGRHKGRGCRGACGYCHGSGVERHWLTDDIRAMADEAARVAAPVKCQPCAGRKCSRCLGSGFVGRGLLDQVKLDVLADALEEHGCQPSRCWICHGKGVVRVRQAGGSADRPCLKCDEKGMTPHPLTAHLRGEEWCAGCSRGQEHNKSELAGRGGGGWCDYCDETTNRLVRVRTKAPHVRGCWTLRLIRGTPRD